MGSEGAPGSRDQSAVTGRQVNVSGDGGKGNPVALTEDNELLEFSRLTVETIQTPYHHPVAQT
jgi:hypothetical protein